MHFKEWTEKIWWMLEETKQTQRPDNIGLAPFMDLTVQPILN